MAMMGIFISGVIEFMDLLIVRIVLCDVKYLTSL